MYLQNTHTAFQIRPLHNHPPVKTARTQKRRVQNLRPVGGSQNQDSLGGIKSVHLRQQLVQGLLPLVISAAVPAVTAFSNGIHLVDKDNTGGIFLGLLKEVTNTGSSHTHEHLHKVRTGQGEKGNVGFSCHRFSQQGLSGSWRSHQKRSFGKLRPDGRVFCRIMQKIHHLLQGFLCLILSGHILKSDTRILLHICFGPAFSHAAHHASALVHSPDNPVHTHKQQNHRHKQGKQRKYQRACGIRLPAVKRNFFTTGLFGILQPVDQFSPALHHSCRILILHSLFLLLTGCDCQHTAFFLHSSHLIIFQHLQKFTVGNFPGCGTLHHTAEGGPDHQRGQNTNQQNQDRRPVFGSSRAIQPRTFRPLVIVMVAWSLIHNLLLITPYYYKDFRWINQLFSLSPPSKKENFIFFSHLSSIEGIFCSILSNVFFLGTTEKHIGGQDL